MRYIGALFIILLFVTNSVVAGDISLGLGVVGGMDFPIAQFDQSKGSIFGFKARIGVLPAVVLEPNIYFSKYGDPPEHDDFVPDIEGNKITAYGLDAALGGTAGGTGIKPYGVFGIGIYKTTQAAGDVTIIDVSKFGWSAGFGLEVGVAPQIGIDFRGKVAVVSSEGGGSKKSGSVTGGLQVYLGK